MLVTVTSITPKSKFVEQIGKTAKEHRNYTERHSYTSPTVSKQHKTTTRDHGWTDKTDSKQTNSKQAAQNNRKTKARYICW